MTGAVDALRRYHYAQGEQSADEVERDCASKRKRCSQLSMSTSAKFLVGLRFRYIERLHYPSCNGNNRSRLCESTLDTLKAEACVVHLGSRLKKYPLIHLPAVVASSVDFGCVIQPNSSLRSVPPERRAEVFQIGQKKGR